MEDDGPVAVEEVEGRKTYVLGLEEVDRTRAALVGGKAAHLGELTGIEGIAVPSGFCVTTAAFRRTMEDAPSIEDHLVPLSRFDADDHEEIRTASAALRHVMEAVRVPEDVAAAINASLARLGERRAYAVRSSATAEDLPGASFAGQHDTYLGVVGPDAILEHVRRCWASLFTERAVAYRLRNGFDHRAVHMAVVVQTMAAADAAGVLFSADPVTSNRKVIRVEAVPGLGEAYVSGTVDADAYEVRGDRITDRSVAAEQPVLTDARVLALARLGRRIEGHFGRPQDVEWCLAGDAIHIVQSRPITTLFPIPEADDDANRVYLSVGHAQMMTDAMKPLGLSVWRHTTRRPMVEAGSRLFVDVTAELASPARRAGLLEVFGRSDPLLRDALETVLEAGFVAPVLDDGPVPPIPGAPPASVEADPAVLEELVARTDASIAALERDIAPRSGPDLLSFILADFSELQRLLFDPQAMPVILAAMDAVTWLDGHLREWLGKEGAADTLARSVPTT